MGWGVLTKGVSGFEDGWLARDDDDDDIVSRVERK
jgi:hypothetical protein